MNESLKRPGVPLEQPKQTRLPRPKQSTVKIDRSKNPLFIIGRSVYLLTSSEQYKQSYKVLAEISQPISRPTYVHEYQVNQNSIIKAIALGHTSDQIINSLCKYMRNDYLPQQMYNVIYSTSKKYNCARMYLEESTDSGNYVVLELDEKAYLDLNKQQLELFNNMDDFLAPGKLEQIKSKYEDEPSKMVYRFKLKPNKENRFAKCLYEMMMPFHTEYAFNQKVKLNRPRFKNILDMKVHGGNYPLKDLKIELKTFTKLRSYQQAALKSIFFWNKQKDEEFAKSGIIVLPCGAGKTLLGISVACKIKKETLIICSGEVSVQQWRREILKWTSEVQPDQIIALTSRTDKTAKRNNKDERGIILISSYTFLTSKITNQQSNSLEYDWIKRLPWGLIVFDEVQWLPANNYQHIMYNLQCHCKIGLTATPYRQDKKIECLNYFIGPVLYEGNWRDFVDAGYLANPYCIEIRCKLTDYYAQKYQENVQKQVRDLIYCSNPNKVKALIYLVQIHEEREDQTIIFCDSVPLIKFVSDTLKRPFIYSDVSSDDKRFIYQMFRRGKFKTILVSRTGDQAIDLPNANVAIELNIHKGSRKQVLQRLGRIMRQKDNPSQEYNAFFYTLVSQDTAQKIHFNKRQKCLVDLGFQYDILKQTDLEYNKPQNKYHKMVKQKGVDLNDQKKYLSRLLGLLDQEPKSNN